MSADRLPDELFSLIARPGRGVAEIVAAAEYHGVLTLVEQAARRSGERPELMQALAGPALELRAYSMRCGLAAAEASSALQASSLRHAIVKGPAIARFYPGQDRYYGDVDVLVAPEDMQPAIGVLTSMGAVGLEPLVWPRPDGIGELQLSMPGGIPLDLHGHLIQHEEVRRRFALDSEQMLGRRRTAVVDGCQMVVLDDLDCLIHVAVHAVVAGGHRLVWLADTDALASHIDIDAALVSRARGYAAGLPVAVMLARARRALGTAVPTLYLLRLARRGWLWLLLLQTWERLRPTAGSHRGIVRGQVLVRATRRSTLSSIAALLRLVVVDVLFAVAHNRDHPWRHGPRGQA